MMLGRPLIRFDRVSSTMDIAAALARSGTTEGTCIVANEQLAGRGRADRRWDTPPGAALLCSVVLRPGLQLPELSPMAILVADAIAATAEKMCNVKASIKWPNDVLIAGRKLSGVLIQTLSVDGNLVMIVGFGINANIPLPRLSNGATSLLVESGEDIVLDDLRILALHEVERRYAALREGQLHRVWSGVKRRLAMKGEHVSVMEGEQRITGRIQGLAPDGALLLAVGDDVRRIVSGDVVRGPRVLRET